MCAQSGEYGVAVSWLQISIGEASGRVETKRMEEGRKARGS